MTAIQSIREAADHFALFGFARRFDIDSGALESKYLELTRLTHPDFAGADSDAQVEAMEASALVNDAYRVLADPPQRAEYLLGLMGGPSAADDKSLPDGFLDDMMAMREAMAEAQSAGDASAMQWIRGRAISEREARLATISRLFSDGALKAIRTELNALRYITRLIEQSSSESKL